MAVLLNHRRRGSAIALAATFALTVLILGAAALAIILRFRVQNQLQSAADAAALTVANRVMKVSVDLKQANERFLFTDVANDQGEADLLTINRILGKALLVAANGEAAGGPAKAIASAVVDQADDVSNRLAREVNKQDLLKQFFREAVRNNQIIVSGKPFQVEPGAKFETSFVDRGVESNIRVGPGVVPASVPLGQDTRGNKFVKGYTPFRVGGNDFVFVPTGLEEGTKLVDRRVFEANTQANNPLKPAVPVPNAFSVDAVVGAEADGQRTRAFARIPSPALQELSIPGGFVLIEFDPQVATFGNLLFSGPTPIATSILPPFPTPLPVVTLPAVAGSALIIDAIIGEEMVGSLSNALFPDSLVSSGESEVLELLIQRVRQIDPDFTKDQLKSLLQSTPFSPQVVIFKDDDGEIAIADPARAAVLAADKTLALRLPLAKAESSIFPPSTAIEQVGAPRPGTPGKTSSLQCVGSGCTCRSLPGTTLSGVLTFTPGTGATGFLGELRVKRVTSVLVSAVCTVI